MRNLEAYPLIRYNNVIIQFRRMRFSKKHPNQKVITQIPDEFVDIPMDSLLIEQVLLNLLGNTVFHAKGIGTDTIITEISILEYIILTY